MRNVAMLDQKAPIPETGWGCFQCGLPQNGALAVLCDDCIENIAPILRAYLGDPASQERIEIERLSGPHRCDLAKHPEAKAEGRVS